MAEHERILGTANMETIEVPSLMTVTSKPKAFLDFHARGDKM